MDKRTLSENAKTELQKGNIKEATILFKEFIDQYSEELSDWDAFFIMQARRKGCNLLDAEKIAEEHIEFPQLRGIYAWFLYDEHVKRFDSKDIYSHEKGIDKITELIPQKDFSVEDSDEIPCPYTLGVFKLIKAFRKPNLNIQKVKYWIDKLEPQKLSNKEYVFNDNSGKERRLASPLENYHSAYTDLKLKEGKFEDCIRVCDEALGTIRKFHYDNDIWFKRRKALAMIQLGQDEGFDLLISLSKNRKGEKWFIFHEIAEIFFEYQEFEKCLEYCKKGIGAFGDEAFKINLFILTARALWKLQKIKEAELIAKYIASVTVVHKTKEKEIVRRIFEHFKINPARIEEPQKYLSQCRRRVKEILQIEDKRKQKGGNVRKNKRTRKVAVLDGKELEGSITAVHNNGLSGFVVAKHVSYFFSMRDVQANKKKLAEGVKVVLVLKDAKGKDGKPDKHAVILRIV